MAPTKRKVAFSDKTRGHDGGGDAADDERKPAKANDDKAPVEVTQPKKKFFTSKTSGQGQSRALRKVDITAFFGVPQKKFSKKSGDNQGRKINIQSLYEFAPRIPPPTTIIVPTISPHKHKVISNNKPRLRGNVAAVDNGQNNAQDDEKYEEIPPSPVQVTKKKFFTSKKSVEAQTRIKKVDVDTSKDVHIDLPEDQLSPSLQDEPDPPESEPSLSPLKISPSPLKSQPIIPEEVPLPPPPPGPVQTAKRKFFTSKKSTEGQGKAVKKVDFKAFFGAEDSFSEDNPTSSQSTSSSQESDVYVTVHRIRKAHTVHEMGETSSFDEDIKYYLNSLEKTNSIRIRCLSVMNLTSKCMTTEFRMHLRAHDDMPRIMEALSDAPTQPALAFCVATLMFIYNQDRLTMDIDPDHLKLMLDLLEVKDDDQDILTIDEAHRVKAKELVEQMKTRGHGRFLDPKNLSTGKLAMEALLGLTGKRAGDWFKEELRNLKGLDYLMATVVSIVTEDSGKLLSMESELSKVDRTLRVLEAATYMHEDNQLYLINFRDGHFIRSCQDLLIYCKDAVIRSTHELAGKVYLSTMLTVLRVFSNVTSESCRGSHQMGISFDGLFELFLDILFEVPSFVLPDSRFDLMVLLLCLAINFVEFCPSLRVDIVSCGWKTRRLVDILTSRIEEAKITEEQADQILESAEKDKNNEVVNIDTLLNQVVAKSGKHMEHSIVAACVSLLLGCSVQDDIPARMDILQLLPDQSFDPLIDVLRKLHEFAHLADIMTPTGVKRVERILKIFKNPGSLAESPDKKVRPRPSSPSLMSINDSFLDDTRDDDLLNCSTSS